MQPSFHSLSSKTQAKFAAGLCAILFTISSASAVSTAIASASLSFRVTSSNGPLHFSSPNLNGDASVETAPPPTTAGYSNSTGSNSLSSSEAIGANSINTSSSIVDSIFTSTSGVSLALPPFSSSSGLATSYNYANIDISDLTPVGDFFDIKFSSVSALLNLNLGNDAAGIAAFGEASWFVSLNYTLPGEDESGSNSVSLSRSIGTSSFVSENNNYTTSFQFSNIPANATDLQLFWETSAETRALDETPQSVPEGGPAVGLLGLGLVCLEFLRRRWHRS